MKKNNPISEIMTRDLHTLDLSNQLDEAEEMFRKHHVRHLPVIDEGRLVGILSLTDLQRISFAEAYSDEETVVDSAIYKMLSVEQVMVSNPVRVSATTCIKEVAEILASREFHALPVVEEEELVGIITTTDLIQYMLNELQRDDQL